MENIDEQLESLEEAFDMEETEVQIKEFKEVLKEAKNVHDPTQVLSAIIDKAGSFLDRIEKEMEKGNTSGKIAEAAASFTNSIIQAANSISNVNSTWFENKLKGIRVRQKNRELDQKDKELEIKDFYYRNLKTGKNPNNNKEILVTDRESILRFLKNNEPKEIEQK